jgi:hypothetical protein
MRKLFVLIALTIALSCMNSVSAMTTGKWDLGAGQRGIQQTVQQMVNQSQKAADTGVYVSTSEYISRLLARIGK